ncbi:MAG: radical SAM protein [Candidatus Hydrothermarchaeales archaeon]
MFRLIRPDSIEVQKDEKARRSLSRYFAVMEDKLPSKCQISKKIEAEIDLSSSTEKLWKKHGKKVDQFNELQNDIDSGRINIKDLETPKTSFLDLKVELAERMLESCELCERRCGKDRKNGKMGFCKVGFTPLLSSEFLHYGEEPELVPSHTIFFCGCTFYCIYCQNYTISRQIESGIEVSPQRLASVIDKRRTGGSRNVNWVGGSPTPNLHFVLKTLGECKENIPSVWNSNMYMSEASMKLLEGTQDVYLADFKYGNNRCALRLSKVPRYWDVVKRNHKIAFDQAELIIRHLVLPNHLECCTKNVLNWISQNLKRETRVNVMFQYRPMFKAFKDDSVNRNLTSQEMTKALELAKEAALTNVIT